MAARHVPFRLLADLVRVGAVVGALAALVGIPSVGIGARFLLVLLVLLVPRVTGGVPAPLDLALGLTLLAASGASTASWFVTTPVVWLAHAAATGITAVVLLYVVHVAIGVPGGRARVVGRTVLIGLVVGGVWETYRWFESIALPAPAGPGTVGLPVHLLVDAVGALVAGLLLATLHRPRDPAGVPSGWPIAPDPGPSAAVAWRHSTTFARHIVTPANAASRRCSPASAGPPVREPGDRHTGVATQVAAPAVAYRRGRRAGKGGRQRSTAARKGPGTAQAPRPGFDDRADDGALSAREQPGRSTEGCGIRADDNSDRRRCSGGRSRCR